MYKNGQAVAGGKLGKELSIQKRLDISKFEAGDYELVVSDKYNDHTFTVCK